MSKSTKTITALAILAASGIAAAAKPLQIENLGIEDRDGLVAIQLCAKADIDAGTSYVWSDNESTRFAIKAGSEHGCFERLGRNGDLGYSQAGVTLIGVGNVYRVAVGGKPAGQALRAMTTPADAIRHPEMAERMGAIGYSGYSASGNMTVHSVEYSDGTHDVVRRVGHTELLAPGTHVTLRREQIAANSYWVSIQAVH